jgi:hypothetical protein
MRKVYCVAVSHVGDGVRQFRVGLKALSLATLLLAGVFLPARCVAQTLVAGTGGIPPALQNSFHIMNEGQEGAVSFITNPGAPWTITQVQVAAYHYDGIQGDSATFRIYTDVLGLPGTEVVSFAVTNLPGLPAVDEPSSAPVLNLIPTAPLVLQPSTKYWLSCITTQQQVNWVHGLNALAPLAFKSAGGAWQPSNPNGNAPAFALLGMSIPEPTSLLLCCLGTSCVVFRRR